MAYTMVSLAVLEVMSRDKKGFVDGPMEGHRAQKGHLSYWRITQLRTDQASLSWRHRHNHHSLWSWAVVGARVFMEQ